MKPLLSAIIAYALLLGVVYGAAATEALADRPLAVLGMLLIGIGLVRQHRTSDPASTPVRADRSRD